MFIPTKHIITLLACTTAIIIVLYFRPLIFKTSTMPPYNPNINENRTTSAKDLETPREKNTPLLESFPTSGGLKVIPLPAYVWPPLNIKTSDGLWAGADADITVAILKRIGFAVQFVDMPFKRILNEMQRGTYPIMLPCAIGDNREDYLLFSEPVSSIYSVLWKKADNPFEWQTYDDLKGLLIGASHYHYGAGFFAAGKAGKFKLDMVASPTPELIHFRKLLQGKTDLFICELSVGQYLRHENSPEFDSVDYCRMGVGPTRPFCFAASRKYFQGREKEMEEFITLFNSELLKYSQEGERKRVFEKYHMPVLLNAESRVLISDEGGVYYAEDD